MTNKIDTAQAANTQGRSGLEVRRSTSAARAGHISAWRAAGQTQAAYCAAHGLHATTFSGWLASERRLSAQVLPPAPPVPLRTLTAVAVRRPGAQMLPTARSVDLHSRAASTASTASTASSPSPAPAPTSAPTPALTPAPAPAHALELTVGTRWRVGFSEALSPRWLAGLLRALDEHDEINPRPSPPPPHSAHPNPNPNRAATNPC